MIKLRLITALAALTLSFSVPIHAAIKLTQDQWKGHSLLVVEIKNTQDLSLVLNDPKQQAYLSFDAVIHAQACSVEFMMNAGMFHADFSPVGLYIENGQIVKKLNTATQGVGNFLIQPNGVLYWDEKRAGILTTEAYQKANLKPRYATQSGPMLVSAGNINPNFIVNSQSKKIRNAVGVLDETLWFVLSDDPVNFYDFADFFKTKLKVDQALYLDGGSVPSIYLKTAKILKQKRFLGPMIIYQQKAQC